MGWCSAWSEGDIQHKDDRFWYRLPTSYTRVLYGSWTQNLADDPPHACGTPDAPCLPAGDHPPGRVGQMGSHYPPPSTTSLVLWYSYVLNTFRVFPLRLKPYSPV